MKKNTWKKLMSLALGAMMMLSLLTGCGSKTEDSAPADSTPAEETPAEPQQDQVRLLDDLQYGLFQSLEHSCLLLSSEKNCLHSETVNKVVNPPQR